MSNKMLNQAKQAAAQGKAPHQQQGPPLRKAGDANIDPADTTGGAPAPKKSPSPSAAQVRKKSEERVPFGSYLPADLHKEFKVLCTIKGIEMQDALAEAVGGWVAKNAQRS